MIIRSKDLFVGTWNVLALYRAGALKLLLEQLDKYKAGIIALQEIRWTGKGILERKRIGQSFIGVIKGSIFWQRFCC
jgi:exonuclease III